LIKIRLCFSKAGPLRFIGHLDFLKVFQKTIRRAALPIAYSQGFNPHMQLSFALPLPLGMISNYDYADLILEQEMHCNILVSRLNQNAPTGLIINNAWEFTGQGSAALVAAADYFLLCPNTNAINETIKSLLSCETIITPKKTKSGIKDTDIRQDIFGLHIIDEYNSTTTRSGNIFESTKIAPYVSMRLAASSGRFLNPLIVAKLLTKQEANTATLIRYDLYYQDEKKGLISLDETINS